MKKFWSVLRILLICICVGVILYSAAQLYQTYHSYHQAETAYDATAEKFVKPVETPQEDPELPTLSGETTPPLHIAPIEVDFHALAQESEDVIGWIYCPDTVLNYPVVQTGNNSYYLDRLANGEYNYSGSVFADYRNQRDFKDPNTVLYGHNMHNDTMFAVIEEYRDPDFFAEHPVLYLLTPEADYEVTVMAGLLTDGNSELYDYALSPDFWNTYVDMMMSQADQTASGDFQNVTKTVTFSTCAYDFHNARYLLLGSMEKLDRLQRKGAGDQITEE